MRPITVILAVVFCCILFACGLTEKPREQLTTYASATSPFATCAAHPWNTLIERAYEEARVFHPQPEIVSVYSSARSSVGYASELVISFEFRVVFQPVTRTTADEPSPVITVRVPECTINATYVENTSIQSQDAPTINAETLSKIQVTPRDVFLLTKRPVEEW